MGGDAKLAILDWAVDRLAKLMNRVGLNGTRLLWKWNQRRRDLGESGMRTEILWRSTQVRHKMCPSCRALVDRSARTCSECGTSLSGVRAPGLTRALSNLLPGISAATSIVMLVNGFWLLLMIMAQIRAGEGGAVSPFGAFDVELMARFGAGLSRPRLLSTGQVTGGEWWRLVTPMFLHGSLLHFLFNSYMLLSLGPVVEQAYGTARYWLIYLCCGIAGCVASELPRYVITVGASGALMGLIGLLLVHGYRSGGLLGQAMKSFVLRLAIYTVILSLMFNIDHLNHLGGFACGALLALVLPQGAPRSPAATRAWTALALAGIVLVLVAFYHAGAVGRLAAA